MNKNDKFPSAAPELNEEQLESVAGGAAGDITGWKDDYCEICKKTTSHCFQRISDVNLWDQKKICTVCKTWCMVQKGRVVF